MERIEELNNKLKEMCERNGLKTESFQHLKKFYVEQLKWTEEQAVEYIIELFDLGYIKELKYIINGE